MKFTYSKVLFLLIIGFVIINCRREADPVPVQNSSQGITESVRSSTGINLTDNTVNTSTGTGSVLNSTTSSSPSSSMGNSQTINTVSGSAQSPVAVGGNSSSNSSAATTTSGSNSSSTNSSSNQSSSSPPPTSTTPASTPPPTTAPPATQPPTTTPPATTPPAPAAVSYALDIAPILQNRGCTGCHGYTLASSQAEAGPASNVRSILNRINRTQGSTGFMPRNGSKMPQSEIDKIQEWFDSGMNP